MIKEIEQTKKEKKKYRRNIFSSFGFIFAIFRAIFTGEAMLITYWVGAIFNVIIVEINSWNIVEIKNKIKKEYTLIL